MARRIGRRLRSSARLGWTSPSRKECGANAPRPVAAVETFVSLRFCRFGHGVRMGQVWILFHVRTCPVHGGLAHVHDVQAI
jgi:hypothetical protein